MVPPASARISRVLTYSGSCYLAIPFHIRGYHPLWLSFPEYSIKVLQWMSQSSTPDASIWFALFPVRSPLLRESRLISFPLATEMFHFASRDQSFLTAPPSLSQSSTSFIASTTQGIHHLPLLSLSP